MDDDFALALQLQSELFDNQNDLTSNEVHQHKSKEENGKPMSLVDPFWETTDPNPDVRALFLQFNDRFFWGRLAGVEVRWSPRMTVCAGLCCYEGRGGLCSVRLSVPLLKLRPRKDLIETLLHEMIHAYLFVTDNNKDHDGHGPEFHKHMYRLNAEAGTSISVYHNFHDEVNSYKTHWWRCNGPCQTRKPYFGYVKRSMNRAPSKNDTWWVNHERSCGGSYTKVKEPEDYGKKSQKNDVEEKDKKKDKGKSPVKSMDIRVFGGKGKTLTKPISSSTSKTSNSGKPTATVTGGVLQKNNSAKPTATVTGGVLQRNNGAKPTATVTSGILEKTKRDVVTLDSDSDNEGNSLPGSRTPASKSGRLKKTSNKPVSQGGSAVFDKIKKTKFPSLDFSDSEDDDEMSRLVDISLKERDKVFGSGEGEEINTKEAEETGGELPIDDRGESSDTGSEIVGFESDAKTATSLVSVPSTFGTKVEETDPSDVRAMLRKIWGEKQFNKTEAGGSKVSSLSDIGSGSVSVKRPSIDDDTSLHRKRQKTSSKSKESYLIHSASGNDKGSPKKTGAGNYKGFDKVTSPIDKLFKKMKDKGIVDKRPVQTSINDAGYSGFGATCDTRSTETTNGKGDNSNPASSSEAVELAPCPVCSKSVPASAINDHLDLCLTLQAIG